jgi:hypothetical protein
MCCLYGKSCLEGAYDYTRATALFRSASDRPLSITGEIGLDGDEQAQKKFEQPLTGIFSNGQLIQEKISELTDKHQSKCPARNFSNDNKFTYSKLSTAIHVYATTVNMKVKHGCPKKISIPEQRVRYPSFAVKLDGTYLFSEKIMPWKQAIAQCKALGGSLANIWSDQERIQLTHLIKEFAEERLIKDDPFFYIG